MPTDNRASAAPRNPKPNAHAPFEIRTVEDARAAFSSFLDDERELKTAAANFFKLGGQLAGNRAGRPERDRFLSEFHERIVRDPATGGERTRDGKAGELRRMLGEMRERNFAAQASPAAQREQTNLLAAYRNSVTNVQISKQAQLGVIEADRSQATRGASNQAAREQQQALIAGQIGDNNVEQSWWNFGADAAGAGAAVATGRDGGGAGVGGPSVSGIAMRPSTIMNEGNNVDIQRSGSIGTSSEYLARTARSNDAYAQDREGVETTRASQTEEALAAQYGVQSGAIGVWNAQVNRAADTQARMSGRAATESTAMLNEAAQLKLEGAEESITLVRDAGLQAAEWHRMAQIIGQVSHDITRRIEEMGQYHF
jgi:hypothetical protein